MLRTLIAPLALWLLVFAFARGLAAEKKPEVKPELAADPAVLKTVKGLGENASALLPPLKTAGPINAAMKKFGMEKNGPKPRDYCRKWVWAADRKRALFCGANAGAPHRFNDVWAVSYTHLTLPTN